MPTGYTAAVADGTITDLRAFALQCARGMGACVTMRDEPWDAAIPERFEPSTSHRDEKLAELRAEYPRIAALTEAECAEAQRVEREAADKAREEYAASKATQRERYEAMIAKVQAWSTDAEGIRDFMLSQLRESLDFDCREYPREVTEPLTADGWKAAKLAKLAHDIAYHERERAAEVARTEDRNRWLAALRASLPAEGPDAAP